MKEKENSDRIDAITMFNEMARVDKGFDLFEPHLWKDKIGDSLWHCEIRSCDALLASGRDENKEDAIRKCYFAYKNIKI